MTLPDTTTYNFSGYGGGSNFYGSGTSYGSTTTTVPISIDRFNQGAMYLKNVNAVQPLWEGRIEDYPKTDKTEIEGTWRSDDYTIVLHKSGQDIVAFVKAANNPESMNNWIIDDLKFVFDEISGQGIYLMGNKTPRPAKFEINKFGHLEVDAYDVKFSFGKVH